MIYEESNRFGGVKSVYNVTSYFEYDPKKSGGYC